MNIFAALLDALIAAAPDRRAAIEQLIRDMFMRRRAVLALDMSDFSLSVRRDGILPYLCQIRRMQKLTLPIVVSHQGEVIKYEADNLLAVFDDAANATAAAVAMVQATRTEAAESGPGLKFSIGIDWGDVLVLEGDDSFGDAVNVAYKLGEDIAGAGEVLVTERIREQLKGDTRFPLRELPLSLSGLELVAYHVELAGPQPPKSS